MVIRVRRENMALIACRCPHCGGEVNMDEDLESGFCVYCGNKVINDNVSKVKVSVDRSSEVVNTLMLAKSYLYDKDLMTAQSLLNKVMMIDSVNSDVWYMDAVLDSRNRKRDLERAKQYDSLGIFTFKDYNEYRRLVFSERGKIAYLCLFTFGFMGIFATIPISIIFGLYWLIPPVIGAVALIALVIFLILRNSGGPSIDPALEEAHRVAKSRIESENENR